MRRVVACFALFASGAAVGWLAHHRPAPGHAPGDPHWHVGQQIALQRTDPGSPADTRKVESHTLTVVRIVEPGHEPQVLAEGDAQPRTTWRMTFGERSYFAVVTN